MPNSLLPLLFRFNPVTVANEAAMLAIVGASEGTIAFRTDLGVSFICGTGDPTHLASWTEMAIPDVPIPTLDAIPGAVADVDLHSHKMTHVATAVSGTDALNRDTGDGRYVHQDGTGMPVSVVSDSSVDATSPVSAASSPRNRALRDFRSVYDYGVIGNGSTDDTANLLLASNDCRDAGKKLWVPGGSFKVSGPITDLARSSPLYMEGDGPGVSEFVMAAGLNAAVIQAQGTLGASVAVTVASNPGDDVLVITSTAGLSPGQTVLLRDPTQTILGSSTRVAGSVCGEFAEIKSVDSGTQITLRGALSFGYSTSSDLRLLTGVICRFGGFSIRNPNPGTLSINAKGIVVNYFQDLFLDSFETKGMDAPSVYLQTGFGATFGDELAFADAYDLEEANNPYCIALAKACQDITVGAVRGRYGRHVITTLPTATEVCSSDIEVNGGVASSMSETAWDCHPGTRRMNFNGCTVHNSWPGTAPPGFQIRGPDCGVYNPIVHRVPGIGVSFVYGADRGRLSGGRISNCPTGVNVESSDDCYIGGGLLIDNPSLDGIKTHVNANYAGHVSTLRLGEVRIPGTPSDAGINNNGALTISYDGTVTVPDAATPTIGTSIPTPVVDPLIYPDNMQALTIPFSASTSAVALLTSGTPHAVAVKLPKGLNFTNFGLFPKTAATTQSHCWMALCQVVSSALKVVAVSTDLLTVLPASVSSHAPVIPVNGGSYTVPATDVYYMVLCQVYTGSPTWDADTVQSGLDLVVTGGLLRCGNLEAGWTTPPTVGSSFANTPAASTNSVMTLGVG